MTIEGALKCAQQILKKSPTPILDARTLLSKAEGLDQITMAAHPEMALSAKGETTFAEFCERRGSGEPVAYIVRAKEFWGNEFYVDRRVLIPRPETEILVEQSISFLKGIKEPYMLDLCCGSGCVGVSISKAMANVKAVLADISNEALEVAKINAEAIAPEAYFEFVMTDLFSGISGYKGFDVITANPPYIPTHDMPFLDASVRGFEPVIALDGGEGGVELIDAIAKAAPSRLKKSGMLAIEIGLGQAAHAMGVFSKSFGYVEAVKDLAGVKRALVCKEPL